MILVKTYTELSQNEIQALLSYLEGRKDKILPYQTLSFLRLTDDVFGYKNVSLIALRNNKNVCGFVPQWKKGTLIESVPWRDKGGPVFEDQNALDALREETLRIAKGNGATGVLWKDFCDPNFVQRSYFINVDIELGKFDKEAYWNALPSQVRGKIRQAKKNNLHFRILEAPDEDAIQNFYHIFVENRHRLGVPAYPLALFKGYFEQFSQNSIKLCEVLTDKNEVLSSLILLHTGHMAIDAYSGSTQKGLSLRANDFMIFNVVVFCLEKSIKRFDFGADSPLQESLILYKTKWQGQRRRISSSIWGKAKEVDPNRRIYAIARLIFSRLPIWPYRLLSNFVVR